MWCREEEEEYLDEIEEEEQDNEDGTSSSSCCASARVTSAHPHPQRAQQHSLFTSSAANMNSSHKTTASTHNYKGHLTSGMVPTATGAAMKLKDVSQLSEQNKRKVSRVDTTGNGEHEEGSSSEQYNPHTAAANTAAGDPYTAEVDALGQFYSIP